MSVGLNQDYVNQALDAAAKQKYNGLPETLGHEELLQMHWLTLCFQSPGLEAEYMADVAKQRRPVLMCIFFFDIACYIFRVAVHGVATGGSGLLGKLGTILPQMLNMIALHSIVAWVNWRSRRLGVNAARQEEILLGVAVSLAICTLLVSLTPETSQDYVFATMFLICTSSFLKIRWLWGTIVLALPLLGVQLGGKVQQLPPDAPVHLVVAWAVGGLMSFLADSYRRQMFANQQLARAAAEKEIQEAKALTVAQRALADAQSQAAARALIVAKEKAANEAKSEFMSLMCHEVRTPLNGCLASAEMLLETKLEEEQRELAKTIRVSGSILLSTVSNFLDFFKMEAGKQLDVVRTEVELQELVSDVHCIIEAMIGRSSDVTLMKPAVDACPQYILGDPDRLRGILLNLYTNAAKFTRRGAISLLVSVHSARYRPQPRSMVTSSSSSEPEKAHSNERRFMSEQNSDNISSSVEQLLTSQRLAEALRARHSSNDPKSGPPERRRSADGKSGGVLERQGGSEGSNGSNGDAVAAPGTPEASGRSKARREETSSFESVQSIKEADSAAFQPGSGRSESQNIMAMGGPFGQAAVQAQMASDAEGSPPGQGQRVSMDRRSLGMSLLPDSGSCDGWAHMVSSTAGVVSSSASECGDPEEESPQWLFFEIADTGIGIGPKGLKSLFKEFVQGSEDEMKRPRSRGGTGLGLSICSKQVAVLGGRVGVLSKPGVGSTFWFCIPLQVPDPAAVNRGMEMRRTASWCSRDAFTDGHLGHHAEPAQHHLTGKRSTTAKAHAFRKFHPAYRAASNLISTPHTPQKGRGGPGSETDTLASCVGVGETRRNSAPELAEQWQRPGGAQSQGALPLSLPKQVQRLTQPPSQPKPSEFEPHPETGTQAANFAAAKALLVKKDSGGAVKQDMSTARDMARASHDLRASLNLDRTSAAQPLGLMDKIKEQRCLGQSPGGLGLEAGMRYPSIDEVRESALELDKISAARLSKNYGRASLDLPALSRDLGGLLSAFRSKAAAAEPAQLETEPGRQQPARRNGETVAQDRLSIGTALSTSTRQAEPPVPEDAELSNGQLRGPAGIPTINGPANGNGARRATRGQMRPSMEARWRKLDISMLQGRRVLLAEDNLINQKVAQMMLTSLGMVVEVASNGQEAFQLVSEPRPEKERQFQCVLMDMAMPVMGGVDATLAIRRAGISVPIVAMTANASDRDRDECLSAGMDGFLSKPVLKDRLAEAIMLVVSGRGRYNADALVKLKSYEAL